VSLEPGLRGKRTPPADPLDLAAAVRAHAATGPARRACVSLDNHGREAGVLTYRELDEQARSTAAVIRRKAGPGERALLMCGTGLEFVVGFLGCLYSGVIAVPIPKPEGHAQGPRHWARITGIAKDADPALILTTGDIAGSPEQANLGARETVSIPDAQSGYARQWEDPALPPSAPAFLQYTSGSSGDPKGAVISRRAVAANLWAITSGFRLGDHGRELTIASWLPLFHDMGIIMLLLPLASGGLSVLMPEMAFLMKPAVWLAAMGRYGTQLCSAPNFAYDLCVDRIPAEQRGELDLSALQHVTCGSEPVRCRTAERFMASFAGAGLAQGIFEPAYGLAEATLYVTGEREPGDPRYLDVDAFSIEHEGLVAEPGDGRPLRMISNGRVARNLQLRIVDPDTGRESAQDRVGEIWIAGPSIADGYYRRPDASAKKFGVRLAGHEDAGPFLRTGDLGFVRDGQLFVAGRRDDLVIVDGRNHQPHDVELTVTESHSALTGARAVVFGYERDCQTLVAALAETALGARIADEAVPRKEVERAVRRAVSQEHDLRISAVVLLKPGAIPRTTSGKPQRKASRQLFLDGSLNAW
jgi:acyl-CoA synthetase (AMP-forming)/AMP-acid ligase II